MKNEDYAEEREAKKELPAFSTETGIEYPSWDALVEAESNGYVATAVLERGSAIWTWTHGPTADREDAVRASKKLRANLKKDPEGARLRIVTVRPAWKTRSQLAASNI